MKAELTGNECGVAGEKEGMIAVNVHLIQTDILAFALHVHQ